MNSSQIRLIQDKYPGIQLETREILLVAKTIAEFPACNFLVFGMGNDTPLWMELNKGGRTVFLEDSREWYDTIISEYPGVEGYLVSYATKISEWESLLDDSDRLSIALPEQIASTGWDIILVDGPSGDVPSFSKRHGTEPPGRMSSIYMSSKLVKNNGYVFVHDCHRIVERVYADRFLFDKNLVAQTSTGRKLRKYKISD